MKEYDLVLIGTGSAMNVLDAYLEANPGARVAVIDKDPPGGICLTKGCIPTKILVYPAELVRLVQRAHAFGLDVDLRGVDFGKVMARMRGHVHPQIAAIREGLRGAGESLDYYEAAAEFTAPSTLRVGGEEIRGRQIFLCTGSRPAVPPIEGLAQAGYHTSDTILDLRERPRSLAIVGAGYIAAEFGHFFAAMGTRVTIVGRNARFLPDEEPEISAVAQRALGKHLEILTGLEVVGARKGGEGRVLTARDRSTGATREITAELVLVAAGRESTSDVLKPGRGGVDIDAHGWIVVDEHLRTSQPNVWAFGDANGIHQFKHKANYESWVAYQNAVEGKGVATDYRAVPHAVFTDPEIAGVGMGEAEALRAHGEDGVLMGFQAYADTAKGSAMDVEEGFVKVIVAREGLRILGAHILGPQASVLIQEIVSLMHAGDGSAEPAFEAMHIHPALPEVVQRAFLNLGPPAQYHHDLSHYLGTADHEH